MVQPGVSYTPLDFMPTNRFSTMSILPIPFSPATLLRKSMILVGLHLASVDPDRGPVLEIDLHVPRLVRGRLRRDGEAEHRFVGLVPRVFEDSALVADMHEVSVHAVRLCLAHRHFYPVLLGIVDEVFPGREAPLSPRRDDLDVGRQGIVRELEAHLIVSLARRTVADRIGMLHERYLHLPFRDQGPRDGSPEEIGTLVDGIRLDGEKDKVPRKLLSEILDVDLGCPGLLGLGLEAVQFVLLSHVRCIGDYFASILFGKPFHENRRVEASGIGEYDFLYQLVHPCPP